MSEPLVATLPKDEYLIQRLASTLFLKGKNATEKFRKSLHENEDSIKALNSFISDKDPSSHLICIQTSPEAANLSTAIPTPAMFRKKGIICLRLTHEPLVPENIMKQVIFVEMTKKVLDNLYGHFNEIYMPILSHPANQEGCSELMAKDLIEKFSNYLAQVYVTIGLVEGKTLLPLPPYRLEISQTTSDKEKAHIFEGSIITWTRQIKSVLKQEPEQAFKAGHYPNPLVEIEFWRKKSDNLNSIDEQLQSERVKSILSFLEQQKSTYTNAFIKLQKEVQAAKLEANNNYKFLRTLDPYIRELINTNSDFTELDNVYLPIMHTIYLIWKHSNYYNTPNRLVVLIREFCNAIIVRGKEFVNAAIVFQLIEDDEAKEACAKLQTAIDICNRFKDLFFEYKAKVNGEWKIGSNLVFLRLDSFIERCHEILFMTTAYVQFTSLEKVNIGGTKGKNLSEGIEQIAAEFKEDVHYFQKVNYDIMDITVKKFEDDFFAFRNKLRELERRIASIINHGFDDCDTIAGKFQLLDQFQGLLSRAIIQEELERKHIVLIDSLKEDLKAVQLLFAQGKALVENQSEDTPLYNNLPPVAGLLTWCGSLADRVREPMIKIKNISPAMIDREEFREVQRVYQTVIKNIKEYEDSKIVEWEQEAEVSSKEKLKEFLVKRDSKSCLRVNFDAALVRLLRETRYFLQLGREVPTSALEIYERSQVFRNQICALDMIVFKYNYIKSCLHPVEEPLVFQRIVKMDEALEPAITKIMWKTPDIDEYIRNTTDTVNSLDYIVRVMKEDIIKLHHTLDSFNKPLLERKHKTTTPDDFKSFHEANLINKFSVIKHDGQNVARLIKEVSDVTKTNKKTEVWKEYIEYVNEIVINGVIQAISTSLEDLNNNITPEYIKAHNLSPMFEIRMVLEQNGIQYEPGLEDRDKAGNMMNLINLWIADFMKLATLIQRPDGPGDYLTEIRDSFEVRYALSALSNSFQNTVEEADKFREKFEPYSYLWTTDLNEMFEYFIQSECQQELEVYQQALQTLAEQVEQPKKKDPKAPKEVEPQGKSKEKILVEEFVTFDQNMILLKNCTANIPKLSKFDEKISALKAIQDEIASIKTPHNSFGWLKVNVQPLKNALNVKVVSAIRVYTNFLRHQVKQTLQNIKDFVQTTNAGIKKNPKLYSHDTELLMSVMRTISVVRLVEEGGKTQKLMKRVKDIIELLRKHGIIIEDDVEMIDAAYYETTRKAFEVKADILPLINVEKTAIKKRIEQFMITIQSFRNEFISKMPVYYDDGMEITNINSCYDILTEYFMKLSTLEAEAKEYESLETLFELELTHYKQLKDCRADLKSVKMFWDMIAMVTYHYNSWKEKTWRMIKADVLQETNRVLMQQLKALPREVRSFKGYPVLEKRVKNMQTLLPLVSLLHSEFMEPRHWQEVMDLTGKQVEFDSPEFSFKDILSMGLHNFENPVNEIVDKAQKEAKIEKKLKQIESNWIKMSFEFIDEKEFETKLFQPLDQMLELLDTNQMDLMGMMSQGKYVEYFKVKVEEWREKLKAVDNAIHVWLKVQKNWRRLVNIFVKSEDIRIQLPDDTRRFESLDKDFREMMIDVARTGNVLEECVPERQEVLDDMLKNIEICEKALNEYLEEKKKAFPRFYFVSNQALLDILSNANNPHKVVEYLGDCFDGLKDLKFTLDPETGGKSKSAKGMYSKEYEYVDFSSEFVCEGAVETWLNKLEFKMRATLAEILEQAKASTDLWEDEIKRDKWVEGYCAQLALVTTQMVWTEEVHKAFEDMENGSEFAMKEYLKIVEDRIACLIKKVRGDLTEELRIKVITIITIDVHSRDVVERLAALRITDKEAFAWQSQLKFSWEKANDNEMASRQTLRFPWEKDKEKHKCIIRIVDWARFYSYEYVGNCGRLVITPLTDRCYITLTQALNLNMGGAPAGPAGTGKTETTKDLGRAIGLPVMVFNCSDQMNYETMAQVFKGLAQSGAWGCFDEFNRISIEVLSVVSTQVAQVLDAMKERKHKFMFMDKEEINLVDSVGFFITMNPGYAGRTELPENLKALFRSCAMVVPDLVLICENMLMSEGFQLARGLSRKFVTLYDLSKALLSKQTHYDWGLRAIKSVLRQAGKLKRGDPDLDEDRLLKKALRDFNMPKVVVDDRQIFLNLLDDLFPNINAPEKFDAELKRIVVHATKEQGYIAEDQFALKCIQLSEILEVRHCCFIIGSAGCGKTTIWKTLAMAYIFRGEDVMYDVINPKAVTANELFGHMTKMKEWKDGVLSNIMRNQFRDLDKYKSSHAWKWTILDGDVDPEWIESLNTVMDDNKILTLVSNERIPLTPAMRLLFEVANLRNATPATVSRGGVLFVNDGDIGWKPYIEAWLERSIESKWSQEERELRGSPEINETAKSVFYGCLQTYYEANPDIHSYSHIVPKNDIIKVQTLCAILDALLKESLAVVNQLDEDQQKLAYHGFFLFAAMWALGGSVGGQDDDRDLRDFNNLWRAMAKVKYPDSGHCLDYYFDVQKLNWSHWNTKVDDYVPVEDAAFSSIYIPTIQTARLKYLLNQHIECRKPLLFAGSAGTGKTAIINDYLKSLNPERHIKAVMNFNNFTDALAIQKNIESRVEKKSGKRYGLAGNRQLIYFIDDLNMPFVDKYGTQTPIALIRQVIDYGMVYDREQLDEKKFIEDMLFISCLNPKSGSFTIDLRLQRHFSVFSVQMSSPDILKSIYAQILQAHLSHFDSSFIGLADKLIEATILVFTKILKDTGFSPSAKKFHYQFNLRELSKVVEGLTMSSAQAYKNAPAKMIKLWVHECKRVFEDRLIVPEDFTRLKQYMQEGYKILSEDDNGEAFKEPNIFTSFVPQHLHSEKAYLPVDSMNVLRNVLEDKLKEYNEAKPVMNLVLFDQAMEHIARICRIMDQPGGHALLVGVGGSGKQSLSRLSAFIMGIDVEQIVVSQSFTINDLKSFLQELIKKCVKTPGTPRAFMLTDTQIQDERYLVFVNDLLSSGFIPDLFPKEEIEGLIMSLRNEAKGNGYVDNLDGHRAYFFDKLRKNLHLILCFSPVGEKFRQRARKFPGIINCTMVDWFHGWPSSALIDVANRFIQEVDIPSKELKEAIALNMAEVHASIDAANKKFLQYERRYNYTTPKSFLELIAFYKQLFAQKSEYISTQITRLETGLETLAKTQTQVKLLQGELKIKMEEVEEESRKTKELIDQVTKESEIASAEQEIANNQKEKVNALTEEANIKSEEANKALQEALPALEAAKEAVKCIEKQNITEMKSLPKPPTLVQVVAKAVLILTSNTKMPANEAITKTWQRAVTVMGDPAKFLTNLMNFNGENIEETKLQEVKQILADPANLNFEFSELKKKNTAAAYLGKWLTSMMKFNHTYKIVKPLDDAKKAAEEEVVLKKKELAVVIERVRKINEKVDELKKQLEEAIQKKQAVEREAASMKEKLETAENLVSGLSGENERWTQNVKKLKENTKSIIGDALIAAEFVSYIGAFSISFRKNLWQKTWIPDIEKRNIPMTAGIDPLQILATDSAIAQWKNEGLPADRMSLENAAIITSCSRWPLMIDPQLQGSGWIRGAYAGDLVTLSLTQDRWMTKLINAIQMGKPVLIENLGQEIDATLEPLLSRAITRKGRQLKIELGDGALDYDPKFKLFLQTKLSNPHFRPEIAAQCTIINFIVTEGGLEDQLLAMVVNVERPELEAKKSDLVRKQNDFQVQLTQLEERLLNALSEADPETILDNRQLIESLDNTKKKATEIGIQRENAFETEAQINLQREIYRGVAAEGSMLYFLLISLNFIEHMYQYSLESFTTFFFKAIEKVTTKDENRIEELIKSIRYTIYQWVSRGLFEKHKLTLLSLITFRLMQKKVIEVQYDPAELEFLLNAAPKPVNENPLDWLPNEAWGRIQRLSDLKEFRNLADDIEKNAPSRFKDWYNEFAPEDVKLPLDWKKLDHQPFRKLLVLRCLRPDRLTTALTSFIRNSLSEGSSFIEMDQKSSFFDILSSSIKDATPHTPIFFILSPGADPVKDVEALAKKHGFTKGKEFWDIALGQGQEGNAMDKLERGHKEGHWVMLQNVHLMPKWLIELEKKLDQLIQEGGATNPNFRLFLSAEPSQDIPVGILERCIKLTNEPPAGLKANMKRAWTSIRSGEFEEKDPRAKTILFGLCYFHSTVLERRKFGAKGWNMFYPFNAGDLRDSANVLTKYFEGSIGKIPWDDLSYIFGDIMYGGHIVDDWDRRLCRNYLEHFMNEKLFDEAELFPFIDGKGISFKCPTPGPYDKYLTYIEETLGNETPLAYGLHPNAEIGFRTNQCETLFSLLLELQPRESPSDGSKEEGASQVRTKAEIVQEVIKHVLEDMNLREKLFRIDDIRTKIDEMGPYQNVFLQECEYMNVLLLEIIRSLEEVDQGFRGLLTISDQMEQLIDSIGLFRVPASWIKLAYPSKRGFGSWLENLDKRIKQLSDWKDDPMTVPKVTIISRLFNPQSFLTAIKQVVGRNKWELNKVMLATEITKKNYPEEVDNAPRDGAYIYGLVLEGARWDSNTGQLDESRPKEMFSLMPVVYCKAQLVNGEGKEEKGYYYCPCYATEDRGKTYVFTAQLRTRHHPRKWVLGGVALLMDVESVNEDLRKK